LTVNQVSVWFDDRPYEWRVVTDPRGWPALVDEILTPPPADGPWWVRGHRVLSVGAPHDPREGSTFLLVAVSAVGGAAYYRALSDGGEVEGWVSHNSEPMPGAPALAFSAQGGTHFPPEAVLGMDDLRRAIGEFLGGVRPQSVDWRVSEWVQ
jgi:hypothetical protein